MWIIALNGSPRIGGNTDLIIDKMFEGARQQGHQTQKIALYPLKISPCIDCRQCKQGNFTCPLKDDMPKLNNSLEKADVILFGTPIYWYGPTAVMKMVIDRLRPYILSRKLQGKTGVLVVPSEEGPVICDPLIKMFKMSMSYIGMTDGGAFLTSAYEKGEIAKNLAEMDRAYQFGQNLLPKEK